MASISVESIGRDREMQGEWGEMQREGSSKGKAWRLESMWLIQPLPKCVLYGNAVPKSEPFESDFLIA